MSRLVAAVGWGESGQGAAGVLLTCDWQVRVFGAHERQSLLFGGVAGVNVYVDDDPEVPAYAVVEVDLDLIVVSPDVSTHHPVFSICEAAGIEMQDEVELAWCLQGEGPHAGRPQLVVAGTNGETTTVGTFGEIPRRAGTKAEEVGNIGTPITQAIDSSAGVFAMELSSFQLHTIRTVSPLASICLSVDADHLDWHGSMGMYAADKAHVYENTVRARVYPASDRRVGQMMENADVVKGTHAIGLTLGSPNVSQFGIVEDLLIDHAFVEDRVCRIATLARAPDLAGVYGPHPLVAVVSDAPAAAAPAHAYDTEPKTVEANLRAFRPAEHRHAIIAHAMGLTWVDDSRATNAHAAHASLAGLPPCSAIWIVGSGAKRQDFTELIHRVELVLHDVVVISEDRASLAGTLQAGTPDVPHVEIDDHEDWMFSVVNETVVLSMSDDTVVLAPACISWDQFGNYGQRGDAPADVASRLATQWGSAGGDE